VIGKSDRPRWFEMIHGSVVHDLVRKTGEISVHVISAEPGENAASQPPPARQRHEPFNPVPYLVSAALTAAALGFGELIVNFIGAQSVSLVFLMAVLGSAIVWGLWPSCRYEPAAARWACSALTVMHLDRC